MLRSLAETGQTRASVNDDKKLFAQTKGGNTPKTQGEVFGRNSIGNISNRKPFAADNAQVSSNGLLNHHLGVDSISLPIQSTLSMPNTIEISTKSNNFARNNRTKHVSLRIEIPRRLS